MSRLTRSFGIMFTLASLASAASPTMAECYAIGPADHAGKSLVMSVYDDTGRPSVRFFLPDREAGHACRKYLSAGNVRILGDVDIGRQAMEPITEFAGISGIEKTFPGANENSVILLTADMLHLVDTDNGSIKASWERPMYFFDVVQAPDTGELLVLMNIDSLSMGAIKILNPANDSEYTFEVGWDPVSIFVGGPGPYAYVICEGHQWITVVDYRRKRVLEHHGCPMKAGATDDRRLRFKDWSGSVISPDGSLMVLTARESKGGGASFLAYDLTEGKPKNVTGGFPQEIQNSGRIFGSSFTADGNRLILHHDDMLTDLDVASRRVQFQTRDVPSSGEGMVEPWLTILPDTSLDDVVKTVLPEIITEVYWDKLHDGWTFSPTDWQWKNSIKPASPPSALGFSGPDQVMSYAFDQPMTDVWIGFVAGSRSPAAIEFTNPRGPFGFIFRDNSDHGHDYYYMGTRKVDAGKRKRQKMYHWYYVNISSTDGWTAYVGELADSIDRMKPLFNEKAVTGFSEIKFKSLEGNWQNRGTLVDNLVIVRENPQAADWYIPGDSPDNWVRIGTKPYRRK